jgi:hypothetical protein
MIVKYSDGGPISEARGALESTFEVAAGDTIQFTLEGGDLHPPGTDGIRFRPPLLTQESPQTDFWLAIAIVSIFFAVARDETCRKGPVTRSTRLELTPNKSFERTPESMAALRGQLLVGAAQGRR